MLFRSKTHAKLSLVVRKENGGVRRYCHIGTGNYNPKTARIYEDLGILSADPVLGDDLSRLFNQLSGFVRETDYSRLLVAPLQLRNELIAKINRETELARSGSQGLIRFKLNSLLDEEFIDALYRASHAGVAIELTVRGICALRPGIVGKSENITVRSILGRYLEHSRIYHFGNAGNDEYWIGSADLMHRNLDRRIEALIQVIEPQHQNYLDFLLRMYQDSKIAHWLMRSDGSWLRNWKNLNDEPLLDIHSELIAHTKIG